jgi:hypothetical protein
MGDATKQLSFTVDEKTLEMINSMKKELGVTTAAGVLRKAIAITKIATAQAREGEGGVLVMNGRNQPKDREIAIAMHI